MSFQEQILQSLEQNQVTVVAGVPGTGTLTQMNQALSQLSNSESSDSTAPQRQPWMMSLSPPPGTFEISQVRALVNERLEKNFQVVIGLDGADKYSKEEQETLSRWVSELQESSVPVKFALKVTLDPEQYAQSEIPLIPGLLSKSKVVKNPNDGSLGAKLRALKDSVVQSLLPDRQPDPSLNTKNTTPSGPGPRL